MMELGLPTDVSSDPRRRMAQLKARYGPAFLTGNGETGLQKHDAQGYSQMLNDQTEYLRLAAALQGKAGPNIQYGGVIEPEVQSQFSPATGEDNSDAFGLDAEIGGSALKGLRESGKKSERDVYGQSQQLRKYRGY
jgi:hypothetical protein